VLRPGSQEKRPLRLGFVIGPTDGPAAGSAGVFATCGEQCRVPDSLPSARLRRKASTRHSEIEGMSGDTMLWAATRMVLGCGNLQQPVCPSESADSLGASHRLSRRRRPASVLQEPSVTGAVNGRIRPDGHDARRLCAHATEEVGNQQNSYSLPQAHLVAPVRVATPSKSVTVSIIRANGGRGTSEKKLQGSPEKGSPSLFVNEQAA
jgi:hypothetical protein